MAKAGQGRIWKRSTAALPREDKGPPPVERWNPPFCGDIDMRIAADGTWFYQKTPIGRPALVKLFASVLKREGDKYFLVTPVEKVGIAVDDAPFLAVEMKPQRGDSGQVLEFPHQCRRLGRCRARTTRCASSRSRDRRAEALSACAARLWAKVTRALFYDLVELGEERDVDGKAMFGVASGGEFFAMAEASALREFA